MMKTCEFNKLLEISDINELKHMITKAINEDILLTNNQILKLVKRKQELENETKINKMKEHQQQKNMLTNKKTNKKS